MKTLNYKIAILILTISFIPKLSLASSAFDVTNASTSLLYLDRDNGYFSIGTSTISSPLYLSTKWTGIGEKMGVSLNILNTDGLYAGNSSFFKATLRGYEVFNISTNPSNDTGSVIRLGRPGSQNAILEFTDSGDNTFNLGSTYSGSGNKITFSLGGSVKMTILSSGYIGIATTSPSQKLSVNGYVLADGYLDYSPYYEGDALSAIQNITSSKTQQKNSLGGWTEIDHTSLPEGVATTSIITVPATYSTTTQKVITATSTYSMTYRDLGKELQLAVRGIQQLIQKIATLEERIRQLELIDVK